jgi:YgiT-type zinc finger domain-containing protein
MICEYCGGQTKKKLIRKHHWYKGKLYLLDNVETEVCLECGERYFHAKTLKMLDDLLENEHKVDKLIQVEVINLVA